MGVLWPSATRTQEPSEPFRHPVMALCPALAGAWSLVVGGFCVEGCCWSVEPGLLPLDCANAMPEANINAIKKVLFMSVCSFDLSLPALRNSSPTFPLDRSAGGLMFRNWSIGKG